MILTTPIAHLAVHLRDEHTTSSRTRYTILHFSVDLAIRSEEASACGRRYGIGEVAALAAQGWSIWLRRNESAWVWALRSEEREVDLVAELAGED